MIGFPVLGYWLTTKTPLGRYIYAIGGNESAARPRRRTDRQSQNFSSTPSPACAPPSSA